MQDAHTVKMKKLAFEIMKVGFLHEKMRGAESL